MIGGGLYAGAGGAEEGWEGGGDESSDRVSSMRPAATAVSVMAQLRSVDTHSGGGVPYRSYVNAFPYASSMAVKLMTVHPGSAAIPDGIIGCTTIVWPAEHDTEMSPYV